jgi:hypothetical protein
MRWSFPPICLLSLEVGLAEEPTAATDGRIVAAAALAVILILQICYCNDQRPTQLPLVLAGLELTKEQIEAVIPYLVHLWRLVAAEAQAQ